MKKSETTEKPYCDYCGETSYQECLICGKDVCWGCQSKYCKEYKCGVFHCGSDDMFLCDECLSKPIPQKYSKVIDAYKKIDNLRKEYKLWWGDFDKRTETAEEELKKMIRRRND